MTLKWWAKIFVPRGRNAAFSRWRHAVAHHSWAGNQPRKILRLRSEGIFEELAVYGGQSDFCELVFPLGKIDVADSAEYCRKFFVTPRFVTSKHTKQGHTVRIHGVLSHISRQDNPLLPRTDLRSHARTRASREQQLSASANKRFFGNLHVMAAQLLPAQLLELQRRPQAARRLGLTQAAPKGSIVVPKGELNPRARVIPHLSARQPTPHEILRGRQFFPAASAGARCSHGASLHSRPKPRIRR